MIEYICLGITLGVFWMQWINPLVLKSIDNYFEWKAKE